MKYEEKIIKLLENNNGILLTSDLVNINIPRQYLNILKNKGIIERVSRGIYIQKDKIEDEFYLLQNRFKKGIFSHNTALYFHELTDRTPYKMDMTFSDNYRLKNDSIMSHYVKEELYEIGKVQIKSPNGFYINVYDKERTICDIIKSRNKIDSQIVLGAIKMYAKDKNKNLILLSKYAKIFRIEKVLKQYMEVLI